MALALMAVLSIVAFARSASAGSLGVRDEARDLTPSQVQAVRDVLARAPFDGRLVVTTAYPDAQELSRYTGSLVTAPNLVVVGLDPEHRHVEVHFGTGSGVPRSAWTAVERAGNDAFRRGDWAAGVGAIFEAASGAASGTAVGQPAPSADARPSLLGPGLFALVAGGIVVGALYFSWRRRSVAGYVQPPYGAGYGPGPGGSYGPGYGPPSGGMGPLGGGLIGAGLGGLAGYELGKAEGEREERERDQASLGRGDDWSNDGGASSGDFDAGGGGSSWDDGGGGDSGGGGSDF